MRVEITAVSPEQVEADVVAVPLAEDGLDGRASVLDSALGGLLGRLAGDGELRGETGRASLVHVDGKLGAARVAVAGIGRRDRVDADSLRTAAAAVAHDVGSFAQTVAWVLDDSLPVPVTEQARAIVEGTALGAYDTARWKRDEPRERGRGPFAGVAQGSDTPARLVVLRYDPPNAKGDVVLGLVGKAITF